MDSIGPSRYTGFVRSRTIVRNGGNPTDAVFCLLRVLVLLAAALASGCASLVSTSTQKITINTTPPGASVKVDDQNITTPGVVRLERKEKHTIFITKEGYQDTQVHIGQTFNNWVFGNILCGGPIGVFIDAATGALNNLTPADINVVLNKVPGSATAPDAETGESGPSPPASVPK